MGPYLWGDVIWGPTEGSGRDPVHHVLLAHPEVRDLDVPLGVQHDVVQLQVPARKRRSVRPLPQWGVACSGAGETG